MEKMSALTKVLLSIMGIFFIIKLVPQVVLFVPMLVVRFSPDTLAMAGATLLIVGIIIYALIYLFIYKPEFLAQKIVRFEFVAEDKQNLPWFPIALRLVCVFAGLHCLLISSSKFIRTFYFFSVFERFQYDDNFWLRHGGEYIISCLLIIAAVYLICGAPHFVRWQVKKTLEQCSKLENNKSASN